MVNEGTIETLPSEFGEGDAIVLEGSGLVEVDNLGGAIRASDAAITAPRGDVSVRNDALGTIAGAIGASGSLAIDNAGLLEGGVGVEVDGQLINRVTGVVRGSFSGGVGTNVVINDGLFEGRAVGTQELDVVNTGTLLGEVGVGNTSIDVVNSGVVRAQQTAIFAGLDGRSGADAVVANTGAIVAGGDGLRSTGFASLDNDGTITTGDDGVDANFDASVRNTGVIDAGDDGVVVGEVDEAQGVLTIENTGTIEAGSEGVQSSGAAAGGQRGGRSHPGRADRASRGRRDRRSATTA